MSDSLMTPEHHTNQDYALWFTVTYCATVTMLSLNYTRAHLGKIPETFEDKDQLLKLVEPGVFCLEVLSFKKTKLSLEKTTCKTLNCTNV